MNLCTHTDRRGDREFVRVNATDISELGKIRFYFSFFSSHFQLGGSHCYVFSPSPAKSLLIVTQRNPGEKVRKSRERERERETFGCVHVTWYDRFFDNNHAYVHRTHKLLPKKEGGKVRFQWQIKWKVKKNGGKSGEREERKTFFFVYACTVKKKSIPGQ